MKVTAISGNFDPLHIGHLRHIREAQKLSEKLIVILTTDRQCAKKKKGLLENCVILPYTERKELIEGYLRLDDEVVPNIDDDLTSAKSLGFYQPDIFAKGGDRDSLETLPENEIKICQEKGIEIVFGVGGGKIQASSNILGRIEERVVSKMKEKLLDRIHSIYRGYRFGDNAEDILALRDLVLKEVELL